MPTDRPPQAVCLHRLHADFLAAAPAIERHARVAFRSVYCPATRDDAVQEAVAIAWKWFRRAAERNLHPERFPSALARYAVAHVRAGRRLAGAESPADALSPTARRRLGFAVSPLTDRGTDLALGSLHSGHRTPVPLQVQFRLDFPRWVAELPPDRAELAAELMAGAGTGEVARRRRVSPARVSQIRAELRRSWAAFTAS